MLKMCRETNVFLSIQVQLQLVDLVSERSHLCAQLLILTVQ